MRLCNECGDPTEDDELLCRNCYDLSLGSAGAFNRLTMPRERYPEPTNVHVRAKGCPVCHRDGARHVLSGILSCDHCQRFFMVGRNI